MKSIKAWTALLVIALLCGLKTDAYAGNGIPACICGEVTDGIVDTNTNIEYSLYVPNNPYKCRDLVIVFHGWGASEDDYNGMPLYYSLKDNYYNPNAYVCFVSKGRGTWEANYQKNELSTFIKGMVALTGASRVHFAGFSQGTYEAEYISSAYNKWTNAILIDGGNFSAKECKAFKYIIWVAGYDEKSYLSIEEQQYVTEYYEPMFKDRFTSSYVYHFKAAVFGLASENVSKYLDPNVSDYYDYPCIDGITILINN